MVPVCATHRPASTAPSGHDKNSPQRPLELQEQLTYSAHLLLPALQPGCNNTERVDRVREIVAEPSFKVQARRRC
jgi:hypothetical protein